MLSALLGAFLGLSNGFIPTDYESPTNALIAPVVLEVPEQVEILATSTPLVATSTPVKATTTSILCSCTQYARYLGARVFGDAKDIIPNAKLSEVGVGSAIVFKYSKTYHVAYISKLMPDGWWVKEANYKPCQQTERLVVFADPWILGYVSAQKTVNASRSPF